MDPCCSDEEFRLLRPLAESDERCHLNVTCVEQERFLYTLKHVRLDETFLVASVVVNFLNPLGLSRLEIRVLAAVAANTPHVYIVQPPYILVQQSFIFHTAAAASIGVDPALYDYQRHWDGATALRQGDSHR